MKEENTEEGAYPRKLCDSPRRWPVLSGIDICNSLACLDCPMREEKTLYTGKGSLTWAKAEAENGKHIARVSNDTTDFIYYVQPSLVSLDKLRGACKVAFEAVPEAGLNDKEVYIFGHFDKRAGFEVIIGYEFTEEDKKAKDWSSF